MLNEHNLCNYYNLDSSPGLQPKGRFTGNKFAYLDDAEIIQKLVHFSSESQINATFSLPQMHCSSCIFLLEHLHKINNGIIKSQTNFQRKEVFILFDPRQISLRKVVELLAFIGYEPYISLQNTRAAKPNNYNRRQIYKIGVAGFCFANIMMLSFPEYFSSGNIEQAGLKATFSWLNLALSLPALFFSASGFFISAWKGFKQRDLNIDAPIALAILVTFIRSYYEIISGQGAGYLDSGSGIIFFMLIGRWFQDKTYQSMSFDRDYQSYFPLGVTIVEDGAERNIPVTKLKRGNRIIIRNEEMVPADAVLLGGNAHLDYSFISGETTPVQKMAGNVIYAGARQIGSAIELEIAGDVSQSYITQLWNNDIFQHKKNQEKSFIHPWSRYFTIGLFFVATLTLFFWWIYDSSRILPAVSSVLIVACPCSLLLSATFTYGNMLRIFGKNKLYLKNANVIESLGRINAIVFDKTGTLTQSQLSDVRYEGKKMSEREVVAVKNLARHSCHPLSKIISASLNSKSNTPLIVNSFHEFAGEGLSGNVDGLEVKLGSGKFIHSFGNEKVSYDTGTHIHVMINQERLGCFTVNNQYRSGIDELISSLNKSGIGLYLLSGDNDSERKNLQHIFGNNAQLLFQQSPQDKLNFVHQLQNQNKKVLMVGDGLNDAGALRQSNVGIAVSDDTTRFSPACDAILDGNNVHLIERFLAFAKSGKKIVTASFILSICYNVVGLSFAVRGLLSPLIAAILMPVSSISIVLLVSGLSSISARIKGL